PPTRCPLPLPCDISPLFGLRSLLRTSGLVRRALNRDRALDGVVLAMFVARNNLARRVMNDVRANLPGQVYGTVVPRNVRLSEAPSHGLPALLYDIESKGAQSYLSLAQEVIRRNGVSLRARSQGGTG